MSAVVAGLRKLREQAGMSVEDTAHAAEVSPAWLQRVEDGEHALTPGMVGKLTRALIEQATR